MVFSSQPTNNSPLLGPIMLAPGASAQFAGTYTAVGGANPMTNSVVTTNTSGVVATNRVVQFTPTNIVTATARDICQDVTVAAAANCLGPVALGVFEPVFGAPVIAGGSFSLSFPGTAGVSYTVQYKTALTDPTWITLETVTGTGRNMVITDAMAGQLGARFYRVILTP